MPIRFSCPRCGQALRARDDKAGRKLKCPKCDQSLSVPLEDTRPAPDSEGAAADSPPSELIVYDDDVSSGTEEPDGAASTPRPDDQAVEHFNPRYVAVPRWMLFAHGGLLAVLAMAAFAIGMHFGRGAREDGVPTTTRIVDVEGTVKWGPPAKEQGDKDAVLIVWPAGGVPPSKIDVATLAAGKPAPKADDPACQKLMEMGGQYLRAGDGGALQLRLVPGGYRILLLSRNTQLPAGANPKPEDVSDLRAIFTQPEQLLGRQKYHLGTLDASETNKFQHSFGESGKP
jgi:hypothetical protein